MRKVLSVWFKQYDTVLDGGSQENMRCFKALCRIVGKENVDSIFIHPLGEKKSIASRITDIFYFTHDMHNGIRPSHIKEIVEAAPLRLCFLRNEPLWHHCQGSERKRIQRANHNTFP